MSFSKHYREYSKRRKERELSQSIEQILRDFGNEYYELKLKKQYTNRNFAQILINSLWKQGISINESEANLAEKSLAILGTYFLHTHIEGLKLCGGCESTFDKGCYCVECTKCKNSKAIEANGSEPEFRKYIAALQNELTAALLIITVEHPGISFFNVVESLMDAYDIPWSFDSFDMALKEYEHPIDEHIETRILQKGKEAYGWINDLFTDKIDILTQNATAESLETLKSIANRNTEAGCTWAEYFKEFFIENIRYFDDEFVFELVPTAFPEMEPEILQFAMFDAMWKIRWRSISKILSKMLQYEKYNIEHKAKFEVELYYDKIINMLVCEDSLEEEPGVELQNVYEMLIDGFGISEKEVKELIDYAVHSYMLYESSQTARGVMHLIKLLSCKEAFEIIDRLNPHIAESCKSYFEFL
ncbi:MAG: hypothetical protein IJO08_02780 [Clostridia bacterium]|nr:hypothetical protein [Clostridia bacterium]